MTKTAARSRARSGETASSSENRPAAAYARSAVEDGLSIERQIAACHRYADSAGLTITRTYVDNGVSGYRGGRPGFEQMLTELQAGAFDVVASNTDRLARSPIDLERLLEATDAAGATLHTLDVGAVAPADRLGLRIQAACAQTESERRSTRATQAAAARKARTAGKVQP